SYFFRFSPDLSSHEVLGMDDAGGDARTGQIEFSLDGQYMYRETFGYLQVRDAETGAFIEDLTNGGFWQSDYFGCSFYIDEDNDCYYTLYADEDGDSEDGYWVESYSIKKYTLSTESELWTKTLIIGPSYYNSYRTS